MELTKEVIESAGLSEDQVKAVTTFGTSYMESKIAEAKKEFDGLATKNADGILDGVIKSMNSEFGLSLDRNDGEKHADYLKRYSGEVLKSQKSEIEKAKAEYEEKIKGVKDAGTLKEEYESLKAKNAEILQKYANYDELLESSGKVEELSKENDTLKKQLAFGSIKPSFPDTVNPFEAKARWEEFQKDTLDKYEIIIKDGEAIAVDKENEYKTKKLGELLSSNEEIQKLLAGRQQEGLNGKPIEKKKVEGVPFDVPANATSSEISKLINSQLDKDGIAVTHPDRAKKFSEYHEKIRNSK